MSDTRQINARIPVELHVALAEHKQATGEEKSDVIRRGIEWALGERAPAVPPPAGSPAPEVSKASPEGIASESRSSGTANDSVQEPAAPSGDDLPTWLSGRTGIPRALCRRHVKAGRVTVDGEVYVEETIQTDRLLHVVTLDGCVV